MSDKKIIAVLGATGAQGGGLVRSILKDKSGEFAARALTRDVNSDKAKSLANMGAEVFKAELDDFDSLKKAFSGAYSVYGVTNFWEHFSPEKEKAQAKSIANAAKDADVKHIIWSTLEDTRNFIPLTDNRMPTLGNGQYKVPHFDGKGESNKYFTELNLPVTLLNTSFYWDNFIYFGMGPKKGTDGKLTLSLPIGERKLAGIAAEDIGKSAYGIFKNGSEFIGKTVAITGENLTGKQMADSFAKALGQEVVFNAIPFDVYRGLGFPGADDLGNMFQFYHDFEEYFCGIRSVDFTKSINPELKSFDNWLSEVKSKIPLE
ncbi:MAG TPA: NmrA/HSCARG family protein [Ignavibacteriaceae bacterium]